MDDNAQTTLAQQFLAFKNEITVQLQAQAQIIAQQAVQIRSLQRIPKKPESYFQELLQRKFNAKRLHIPGVGTTDLTTDEAHIEIKNWKLYDKVPGQLSKYRLGSPRPGSVVYFFGMPPSSCRLKQIKTLMAAHRIQMFSIDDDDVITAHPSGEGSFMLECHESDPFRNWLSKHLVMSLGKKVHVHQIIELYNATAPKEMIATRAGPKLLKGMGYTVERNSKVRDCTKDCVSKGTNAPILADFQVSCQ